MTSHNDVPHSVEALMERWTSHDDHLKAAQTWRRELGVVTRSTRRALEEWLERAAWPWIPDVSRALDACAVLEAIAARQVVELEP